LVKIEMNSPTIAPLLAGKTLGTGKDSFVIAEWRDAGGPAGPPRLIAPVHLHHNDDEAWYVLEGALCVRVGDKDVEATAGSAVFVPRETPHTYWNARSGLLRYLLVMTPRIYQLIQAIHAMKDGTPDKLQELFRSYDSELL
jgi:mannose-6-phosphate isomerase-like protein (cupin superfamily)